MHFPCDVHLTLTPPTLKQQPAYIHPTQKPQETLEGEDEWVLRVEDKSHEQTASTGEVLLVSATDEEREAFPPLPGKNIMLEQAF